MESTAAENDVPSVEPRGGLLLTDKLLVLLVVVQGLFFISGYWPDWSLGKGWTVLATVAVTGFAVAGLLVAMAVAYLLGRPFHVGLRGWFGLTLAVAVACGWLAMEVRAADRQEAAVAAIAGAGGSVSPRLARFEPPEWLRVCLGSMFFRDVFGIDLVMDEGIGMSDEEVRRLAPQFAAIPHVETVSLAGSPVGDGGLASLAELTEVRELHLGSTQVTDAGLVHLRGMRRVAKLDLHYTLVTGRGLAHLKGLPLITLELRGTRARAADLTPLAELTSLEELTLPSAGDEALRIASALVRLRDLQMGGSEATDEGLRHLRPLVRLEHLALTNSQVTGQGLSALEGAKTLERLQLYGSPINDAGIGSLPLLPNLRSLDLAATHITGYGLEALARLPRL